VSGIEAAEAIAIVPQLSIPLLATSSHTAEARFPKAILDLYARNGFGFSKTTTLHT
jgi:hypothetical protein